MIEGTAMFTIVASTMIIATPTLSIASPIQRRRPSWWMALPSDSVLMNPMRVRRLGALPLGRGYYLPIEMFALR